MTSSKGSENYYQRNRIRLLKLLANENRLPIILALEIARRVLNPAHEPLEGNPGLSYSGLQKIMGLLNPSGRNSLNYSLRVLLRNKIIGKKIAPGETERTYKLYYLTEYGQWLVTNVVKPKESELQDMVEKLRKILETHH